MLASITPLGERGRNRNWSTTLVAYVVGSLVGGAAMGALFGAAGAVLAPPVAAAGIVLAAGLGVAAIWDAGVLPFRLPSITRQVNEDWLNEYRGWVVGAGFGVQLGAGLLTVVTTATVYLVFLTALLTSSVGGGAVVGAAFGLARGLSLVVVRRIDRPERLSQLHTTMAEWSATVRGSTALASLVLAVVVTGAAL